jgi:glycerol kinase
MASEPVYVGGIDQGTSSTRFILFDRKGVAVASHQKEFAQIYPKPGCAASAQGVAFAC